ncbi:hypothetical protein NW762_004814 [Fusarium torreyae]|uniref:Uncharacterized protein n=1 Tax=Fusarium torreyae TaxID=1237075 RepID=A0A9W8S5D3_9HYPO|nr:hypothetical protein NW762_004814 [Fusarium torreyae]
MTGTTLMTGFPNDGIEKAKVQYRVTELGDLGTETEEVGGYEGFDMSVRSTSDQRESIHFFWRWAEVVSRSSNCPSGNHCRACGTFPRDHSLELAVKDWANDEKVEAMDNDRRRESTTKPKLRAERRERVQLRAVLTIKMNGGCVLVRLVKRDERGL